VALRADMTVCDWSDPGCDTTDTDDAEWLFCEHPSCFGLFLATGDSGHSFTSLPVVGGQVADLLEGKVRDSLPSTFHTKPYISQYLKSSFDANRCHPNAWNDSVGGPVEETRIIPVEEVRRQRIWVIFPVGLMVTIQRRYDPLQSRRRVVARFGSIV
jgi:hypothetical protein